MKYFEDNAILKDIYTRNKNICSIVNNNAENENAVVYFSSNGLYYPNDDDTIKRVLVKGDRYEWKKMGSQAFSKNIYVRDIYKSWYIKGINASASSIERAANIINNEIGKKRFITVGSSAGGYGAILFGIMLNAEYVIAFSPQISVPLFLENTEPEKNPIYMKYCNNDGISKYLNLKDIIRQSDTEIFVFYPAQSERDIKQIEILKGMNNVNIIGVHEKQHGVGIYDFTLKALIEKDRYFLRSLSGHIFSKTGLSFEVLGKARTIYYLISKYLKRKRR